MSDTKFNGKYLSSGFMSEFQLQKKNKCEGQMPYFRVLSQAFPLVHHFEMPVYRQKGHPFHCGFTPVFVSRNCH